MLSFTILEHDGLWSLREEYGVFPVFEGQPPVVREYLRHRCREQGGDETTLAVVIEERCRGVRRMELAEML